MARGVTRRELLTGRAWLGALRRAVAKAEPPHALPTGGAHARTRARGLSASASHKPLAALRTTPLRARVLGSACLAWRGDTCHACKDACDQTDARAITFEHGRPQIDPARCTGCGSCRDGCPAPGGAILLIPMPALAPTNETRHG